MKICFPFVLQHRKTYAFWNYDSDSNLIPGKISWDLDLSLDGFTTTAFIHNYASICLRD